MEIYDKESLKKENINLGTEEKKINDIIQKINLLRDNILKEMNLIDKSYEDINNKITESFKLKYENLLNKENELKETLKNNVTKIKEKLENYFSESNNIIKSSDRLNKIIKLYENEKQDDNSLKMLSYISYVNKCIKEIEKFFLNLIINLKIDYKDDEEVLIFNEYNFWGIKYPKDIEFKDVGVEDLNLFWKFDKIESIDLDDKKIKYKVEIRKEGADEKFIQIYEGNNTNCFVDNLIINTTYEFRICCLYDNYISLWSPIQKVKTLDIDSIILKESKRQGEFLKKIFEWSGYKSMTLLYRGTKDGTTSYKFHEKCDDQGPTICLYKNEKGHIFGGYASISWKKEGDCYIKAPDCFIFTLTNIHETEPMKFKFKGSTDSVYHGNSHGAHFGGDIKIFEDFLKEDSKSQFPDDYEDTFGKGKSIFTGDLNNNNGYFKVKEIEVFKLIK